jgi:hypothetical protein
MRMARRKHLLAQIYRWIRISVRLAWFFAREGLTSSPVVRWEGDFYGHTTRGDWE